MPYLPTKSIPAKICWLKLAKSIPTKSIPTKSIPAKICWSGEFPMGLGGLPLEIKILLESNPLKSRILVRRLAIVA